MSKVLSDKWSSADLGISYVIFIFCQMEVPKNMKIPHKNSGLSSLLSSVIFHLSEKRSGDDVHGVNDEARVIGTD